jgi:hypothetical protein
MAVSKPTITLSTTSVDYSKITGIHFIQATGTTDELTFQLHIPVFNNLNDIRPYKTYVEMHAQHEDFYGRVVGVDVDQSDNGTISVTCEGPMGYLRDSFIFPGSPEPEEPTEEPYEPYEPEPEEDDDNNENSGSETRGLLRSNPEPVTIQFDISCPKKGTSLQTCLTACLRSHNAFVDDVRLKIYNVVCDTALLKHDLSLAGNTVYEAIEAIANDLGFEWRIIGSPTTYQLQMRRKFGTLAGDLKTGINLGSVSRSEQASDIYTAIMPLGGVGYDEKRLSLCSQPSNSFADGSIKTISIRNYSNVRIGSRGRPYIENTALSKLYGVRPKLAIYDDIVVNAPEEFFEKRNELLLKAKDDCDALMQQTISINASAFDFFNAPVGGPGPQLTVYNYYNVSDYITGINLRLRLVKKDINYDDILNPSLSFELDDRVQSSEPCNIRYEIPPLSS